ncbi:hypothetical protein I0C86_03870 [Plantactinospora sp. S1510]|uniref:NACHT N-terminal Helical domain-containing protein n=1 Tax=Plantactinospora alkalitolerans TaxID=2789879 RepID=A0ABS0GPL3_9ACTN|nr:hypothetical protein [Plantactinospora alkalitolerans]MBF9128134.1 hypothetical protein [Plantactinospora alkalitolerans]
MPRTLSYAAAARLLGGDRGRVVSALDTIAGGALLGTAVAVPAVLALFDAKAEFVRLSHELVRTVSERRAGLTRYDRTERLAAAHRVLVVTAFFEALTEADLPFRFGDLELTEREQVAVAGAHGADHGPLLRAFFGDGVPAPGPEQAYRDFRAALDGYYQEVVDRLRRFVVGLAAWEWLGLGEQQRFDALLNVLPTSAVDRHQELLGRLAGDFPEVAFWAGLREHAATRNELRQLSAALGDLEQILCQISTGRAPDERRAALAGTYARGLDRSIVESGDVPAGIKVPTLGAAYVPPLCRVAALGPDARPSDESWWLEQPVRRDLSEFLTGYLTTPGAVEAPLLVLGQPGSGKSVLTRVLAAQLPAADFLPVRVVLRDVPAAADLQDQIEYAVRAATGERLDWPALARSAGDALPVVLLDGFDELLQATGVSQTDYLLKVAAFQRREADQGRPVVVLVTSRTSVADRARPPEGTVGLRLEPFDQERVATWLAAWNRVNADEFVARGVAPLDLPTVLAHRELAEQPLLLLMLALYDADGNALRSAGALRKDELYERLLRRFAHREVVKHRRGLPNGEVDQAVEGELRRLSVVAFAMFNRNAQWVTEAQLETDLLALLGAASPSGTAADLRAPLGHAEIVLGRFFFVHRARAERDNSPLETYEFLHATFGEFLVARFAWQVLTNIAAREAAATMSFGSGPPDDDLLHALLSYAALSGRTPILGFLTGLMSGGSGGGSGGGSAGLTTLLVGLFQKAHHARPSRRYESYQPRPLPLPARHAAYSANLLLLAICAGGTLRGGRLYPGRNVVACWHRETLLWQSQLGTQDWTSLVETLVLDRLRSADGTRDIELRITTDPATWRPRPVDPLWTYDLSPERSQSFVRSGQSWAQLARRAYLRCAIDDDVLIHALEPAVAVLPEGINHFRLNSQGGAASTLHDVLAFVMFPSDDRGADERLHGFLRVVATLTTFDNAYVVHRLAALVLDRLANDPGLPADMAYQVVGSLPWYLITESRLADALLRCARVFLGRDRAVDKLLGELLRAGALNESSAADLQIAAEVFVQLAEAGAAGGVSEPFLAAVVASVNADPELRARYDRTLEGAAD